jgi:hypothetical protein
MQFKTKLAMASVSLLTLGGGGFAAAAMMPAASAAPHAQVIPAPAAPGTSAPAASEPANESAAEAPEKAGAPETGTDTHNDVGGQADHQCPNACDTAAGETP